MLKSYNTLEWWNIWNRKINEENITLIDLPAWTIYFSEDHIAFEDDSLRELLWRISHSENYKEIENCNNWYWPIIVNINQINMINNNNWIIHFKKNFPLKWAYTLKK